MKRIIGFVRSGFIILMEEWKMVDPNQVSAMSCCAGKRREVKRLRINPWRF